MKKINKIGLFVIGIMALVLGIYVDATAAVGVLLAVGPAATVGGYTESYASSLDINMEKFLPELIARHGDQGMEFIGMLEGLGWNRTLDVQTIQHFEDDWVWDNFMVEAHAAGAAGASVTLTISSLSIDADGKFYPAIKDIIEFPNRSTTTGDPIWAYVTAATSTTITVKPFKAAEAIPAVTANQELIVVTNGNSEGSSQPDPKRSGTYKYTNNFAIGKASIEATGSEMTDRAWIDSFMGKPVNSYFQKALNFDLDYRMMQNIQGWILGGQEPDNSILDPNNSKSIKWTRGIFPEMNANAIQHPYNDQMGVADFDEIERALSKEYAGTTTCAMLGLDVDIDIENNLKNYFNFTNIDYVTKQSNSQLFGDNEGLTARIRFNYFEKAKRVFALKRFSALNNPKTYNAAEYDYTTRAFMFPLRSKNVVMNEKGAKSTIPAISVVYKALGDYNRKMEVFQTGSANAAKWGVTNDVDNRLFHQRCEFGLELFSTNSMVNIYKG